MNNRVLVVLGTKFRAGFLVPLWLILNFIDFGTTVMGVITGRAAETNIIVNMLGGPLSLDSIILKTVALPLSVWLIGKRFSVSHVSAMLVSMNLMSLVAVASNFCTLLFV